MPVNPSSSPWPPGSSPASPPYSPNVVGQRWSEQLAERFQLISPLPVMGTDVSKQALQTGEIVFPRRPIVQSSSYETGGTLTLIRPGAHRAVLNVNRADSFAIALDHVLVQQADYDLPEIYRAAAIDFIAKEQIAGYITPILSAVPAANKGANAGAMSANVNLGTSGSPLALANTLAALASAYNVLDQQGVPATEGRWILAQHRVVQHLRERVPLNTRMAGNWNKAVALEFCGTPVIPSLALPGNRVIVGHVSAINYVLNIELRKIVTADEAFVDVLRGVVVSGLQVVNPEALVEVYIN